LKISEILKDLKLKAKTLNNIGNMYYYMHEIKKARDYYNKSMEISTSIYDVALIAETLRKIGQIYNDLDDKKEAIRIFNQAYELEKGENKQ